MENPTFRHLKGPGVRVLTLIFVSYIILLRAPPGGPVLLVVPTHFFDFPPSGLEKAVFVGVFRGKPHNSGTGTEVPPKFWYYTYRVPPPGTSTRYPLIRGSFALTTEYINPAGLRTH